MNKNSSFKKFKKQICLKWVMLNLRYSIVVHFYWCVISHICLGDIFNGKLGVCTVRLTARTEPKPKIRFEPKTEPLIRFGFRFSVFQKFGFRFGFGFSDRLTEPNRTENQFFFLFFKSLIFIYVLLLKNIFLINWKGVLVKYEISQKHVFMFPFLAWLDWWI